jgi:NTP pyrophosphatase (non-canonical NTP hydrolase)
MFNLSEKLSSLISEAPKNLKKEKNAQIPAAVPTIASGFNEPKTLAGVNTTAKIKEPDNLVLTDKPQDRTVGAVPGSVSKSAVKQPGVKIAYKRNTGIADSDGLPYTNTDDVILLGKLGYTIDEDSYLFLPRGEERESLYSYIEKNAGVPKDVSRCIDEGKAFSAEYLKSMDYSVPKGYEVKGDLCCPVEKTRKEEKESPEKTASVKTFYHGSPTAGIKELEPKLDPRLNLMGAFVADSPYAPELFSLMPERHKAIINTVIDNGKFISGEVTVPHENWLNEKGYLYEFDNPKSLKERAKDRYMLTEKTVPNRVKEVLLKDVLAKGWKVKVKDKEINKTASDIYNNIVIENPKGSKKEFGKNYPIPVMTYPVDYGYLPGYTAQDDADLDFFKGTAQKDGLHGSFDVWRPDVKGELETKFYTGATELERDQILKAFQKVIRGTPKSYISNDLMEAIKHFAVNKGVEKTASALVVSGIHGDEPAGNMAAKKLEDRVDVVSGINPSNKRRFRGKDINRHFDKPSAGKKQKSLLDVIKEKKPSRVISLHEDNEVDKPYAYSSASLKEETKRALKDKDTAASAHGDKTEDGVISKGKNPPDGSLEKALDDRGIDRVTVETPSKSQDIDQRVRTQLDVVRGLLGKKGELGNTNPSMSLSPGSLQATHSPINMQASTLGQTTPVDNNAKNKALLAAGKSFITDQAIGTIPNVAGGLAGVARANAVGLGRLAGKARHGANTVEAVGHIGAGELSARQADNPGTANMDRALSYASSLLPLITKNPAVGLANYAGNTLYDAANAANVYYKNIPQAPPSMGTVPEQKFNINLKEQPVPDFRLTQPNLRENMPASGVRIAKQGEDDLEKTASPFSRRLMSILNKSDQATKNKVIQQLIDYAKKEDKRPNENFLKKLLGYVNRHEREGFDGWSFMSPEDAADRYSPLTGVYKKYFEKPTRLKNNDIASGRKKTEKEKNVSSLLAGIFGDNENPTNEYSLIPSDAGLRATLGPRARGRTARFEEQAKATRTPVSLSEHELDVLGRHKISPYFRSLDDTDYRHSSRAKDRIKELMRKGQGVKGLLAQYKIDEQPFEDLLFTPHLASRNNLTRQEVMDRYRDYKERYDPVSPGFSDRFLELKLFPAKNKTWAKNPLYEAVVDASNIRESKGPVGVSRYYVPSKAEEAGAILAKNLPNADAGFMYKGGPPSALQAAKKLKNYTQNDERMFFSGVPEVSAGYMAKGDPEYTEYVRPAGFGDIRKRIADSVRQYRNTIKKPVEDYFKNNTVDYVGPSVPTKTKSKAKQLKKKAEYRWHKSKDLHRDVTNNRHYPFSFLTGEAKELVDAVKNRDWANFKEEIGDTTYAAQMLAAQATGLNHPVYADLSKHYAREKVWKDMFKEKASTYHPKHMQGGSNYAKASKIIKAFASAGVKIDQKEAERLANKYTGGKMEKEAAQGGTVVNFPQRQMPPISMPDRLGSLVFGKNYIPSPINGESMYDAMLRSGRNKHMLDISQKAFANNPLFHRLGLKNSPITSLLGLGDYVSQGKLSSMLSPFTGGNVYKANKNIQEMLNNPSVMSQFKQASSNQPMLPGMKQWVKKQPFNYAEDAYKKGRIPKHVRDDIVSGRAAEEFRPKFKEMLDTIVKSRQNK